VSFSSATPAVCTASSATVTLLAVGACTIQATQAGNANWAAAAPVSQSFQVATGSQTITFGALSNQALGAAPFTVSATATSGLAVSFNSLTTSVCTVSGATVTLVAISTCTIQATQPGNANWAAAAPISQSFQVQAPVSTLGSNALAFANTIVNGASAIRTVTLQNTGNTALTITSIVTVGADAANYQYTADATHPCPISPATLSAGASCTLDLAFAPVAAGAHNNAQLAIADNSGNVVGATQAIGLTGAGIVLSSIAVTANNATIAYNGTEQFTATGTYSDNSTAILTNQAVWGSSAANVAGIGGTGLVTALAVGQTNITAVLNGVTSNSFPLTVAPGAPGAISISAGSGQSAPAGTAFAGTLQVLVKDGGGNAVANAAVTFTAPSSGASGTFANGLATSTATTNGAGIATSTAFTANLVGGGPYAVTASTAGLATGVSFLLTNLNPPVLSITKTHVGTFLQGQAGAAYTIKVSNNGVGPTTNTVTVVDALPAGLTAMGMAGTNWNCTPATLTCTRSDALAAGGSYPVLTVTVDVAGNAPASVTNTATVSGGGEINTPIHTATDPTTINGGAAWWITAANATGFAERQTGAAYTLTATNTGTAPTDGSPVTVTDTLPGALTATALGGTGWTCTLGTVSCTRSDVLNAGGSYPPITVTVNVAADAPASVTNSAAVSGGGVAQGAVASGPTSITAAYLVGDVAPYLSDTAPNFGDGTLDVVDLVDLLFAVNNVPGYQPAACSDRFDAMDVFPVDTATGRGGDGVLDVRDLVAQLFRVNNLDMDRPVRTSLGGCAAPAGTSGETATRASRTALSVARQTADGRLVLGSPETYGDAERVPVYLEAESEMTRVALTFALGDQQSPLRFLRAAEAPPSAAFDSQPGVVAVAWLDGVNVPAGARLLLGYVAGPARAWANLKVYSVSGSGLDDGREVRVDAPVAAGRDGSVPPNVLQQ
jgi:hypothetical protein